MPKVSFTPNIQRHVICPSVEVSGATVRDAYIGPYSAVSEDAHVERAEMEHAILLERSSIIGIETTGTSAYDGLLLSAQHRAEDDNDDVHAVLTGLALHTLGDWVAPHLALHVNPTGRFVVGGPLADSGLTGRKVIADTYGGVAHHGGGAFSGKDGTKVDRSAAYAARQAALTLVREGLARRAEVSLAYAIGVEEPGAIGVASFGTGTQSDERLARTVSERFDFRPAAMIERLDLRTPIFERTARDGHFGIEGLPWEEVVNARGYLVKIQTNTTCRGLKSRKVAHHG